jgi:glycerol-3-phosphate dehydrogenase
VINAAGPWCREIAADFDRDMPILFNKSMAWNVLFKRDALSDHALALKPGKPDARIYFLVPWRGKLLVGTGHAGCDNNIEDSQPSEKQLQSFLSDLNMAVPGIDLSIGDITHVFSGFLPARKARAADLAVREVILDHSSHAGPKGLYSVSGVKFTTSRLVADKTLEVVFKEKMPKDRNRKFLLSIEERSNGILSYRDFNPQFDDESQRFRQILKKIKNEEFVVYPEDIIKRRTHLWTEPELIKTYSRDIIELFNMNENEGLETLRSIFNELEERN